MSDQKRKISILLPLKKDGDGLMVYMQKRSADAKSLPNYFGFWGGGAEQEETPIQALQREIREEMGLEIDMTKVELFNHYEFLRSVKDVYLFWPEEGWENTIVVGEGDYGKWFSTEEVFRSDSMILEDKVVVNDLERFLLKKPIL